MKTRVLIRQARTYIPLRQAGRSTFLKTYDVARCMARRIGASSDHPCRLFFAAYLVNDQGARILDRTHDRTADLIDDHGRQPFVGFIQ